MAPTANGYGHLNGIVSRPSITEGAVKDEVAGFQRRFEHSKYGDDMKNALIEDLIGRYEALQQEHNEYVASHQAEREHVKGTLERDHMVAQSIQRMQEIMNRAPHILVLIDGDSIIFNDAFLQQGASGGKQAAVSLHDAAANWAAQNVLDLPEDSKIVVRVYANLKGLGETCFRADIVDSPFRVEEFARGFTCGKPYFDFIDVGSGRDVADAKITESYKLYLYDYHCRQIVFGCAHDKTAAQLLEQSKNDQEALARVTILENFPFEKELATLPFPKVKLPGVLRESRTKLVRADSINGGTLRVDSRVGLNGASQVFTPRSMTPLLHSANSSAINLAFTAGGSPLSHIRSDSITSSAESNGGSWATVTSKNKHKPLIDLHRASSEPPSDGIKRNRAGQRVDLPSDYDREEVQRIKKLKGCNQHYIGIGCCHYNAGRADKCPHNHHYTFSAADLKTLRVVAKETPCKRGHDCDDPKCIYGHMCPFPAATEGSMRGIGCINGETCRFPRSMHNMDTVPVKMTRATGAF